MNNVLETSNGQIDQGRAVIDGIAASGRIGAAELASLRDYFGEVAPLTRTDAEALFELDRTVSDIHEEWTGFFVQTVTDYIVWQSRPTGLVNGAQSEWLLAQADTGRTLNAFAILVNVLAEADRVPAWLPAAVHGRAAAWPAVSGALRQAQAA
ncbi:MAG: hypothetical protein K2Y29_10485 [Beijerinckiaceae bacterium]|nr:hypothetical protein [Beijerinckiaceae bacterium]